MSIRGTVKVVKTVETVEVFKSAIPARHREQELAQARRAGAIRNSQFEHSIKMFVIPAEAGIWIPDISLRLIPE